MDVTLMVGVPADKGLVKKNNQNNGAMQQQQQRAENFQRPSQGDEEEEDGGHEDSDSYAWRVERRGWGASDTSVTRVGNGRALT